MAFVIPPRRAKPSPTCQNGKITFQKPLRRSGRASEVFRWPSGASMGLLKFSDGLPDCQNGKITLRKPLRRSGGVSEEFSGLSDAPAGWPKTSAGLSLFWSHNELFVRKAFSLE